MPYIGRNLLKIAYSRKSGTVKWELSRPFGLKINGINPNAVSLDTVTYILAGHQEIPVSALKALSFSDQKLIPLKNIIAPGVNDDLRKGIRSYYSWEKKQLILMDDVIRLKGKKGKIRSFEKTGMITSGQASFEFFTASVYEVFPRDQSKDYLHKGDTSYHILLSRHYTGFGASTITLEVSADPGLRVTFDKPYTYTVSEKTAANLVAANNNLPVDIIQHFEESAGSSSLGIPDFSFSCKGLLGYLDLSNKIAVFSPLEIEKSPSFVICILPLMIIWSILMMRFCIFKNSGLPGFINKHLYMPNRNASEKRSWQNHFCWLLSILFLFLGYRIFIAYQLTYTSPYFTYFLPTAVLISPFVMIAVYGCWTVLVKQFSLSLTNMDQRGLAKVSLENFVFILLLVSIATAFSLYVPGVTAFFKQIQWKPSNILKIPELLKSKSGSLLSVSIIVFILALFEFWTSLYYRFKRMRQTGAKHRRKLLALIAGASVIVSIFMSNAYSCILLPAFLIFQYLIFTTTINTDRATVFLESIGKTHPRPYWSYLLRLPKALCKALYIKGILSIMLCFVTALFAGVIKHDAGYFINIIFIIPMLGIILLFEDDNRLIWKPGPRKRKAVLTRLWICVTIILCFWFLFWKAFVEWRTVDANTFSSRTYTRLAAYYDFDKIGDAGYRGSEGIAEFFAILSKYSLPTDEIAAANSFNTGISSYSDPVVINDLSFPAAGIGVWGRYHFFVAPLLILCWVLLIRTVILRSLFSYKINDRTTPRNYNMLTSFGIIRLICVAYLTGSGLWLVASYYGMVPFTGRLIFGMGQDSVAEAVETIILFAGMGMVYPADQLRSLCHL
ncbi:MAG TPA: hypothetical protein VFE53_03225 [Mucilaginibacter sp.]|nr:hypothetical protein [Mucilaginibacter sp.]